jgi:hypothetical protein
VAWLAYPDCVTNIISEMPVAVQSPDSGGGCHCYPDLCFTWRQRVTVVVELKYLRGGFWHGCRAGYEVGETVSAHRQRLQRHAMRFRHLFASAASVPARVAQMRSMLQQQWAQRAGPGEPATSVAVGQVVHQGRQQVQRYKRLLLAMLRPPPDPVPERDGRHMMREEVHGCPKKRNHVGAQDAKRKGQIAIMAS